MYFNKFPKIVYDFKGDNEFRIVTNILKRLSLRKEVSDSLTLFNRYDVEEGETPESLADAVYGDVSLYWIICYTNDIYNGYNTYNIYRGSSQSSMSLLTSISSSSQSYSDLNPPSGTVYYQVEVVKNTACSPTVRSANYSSSKSNIADNSIFTSLYKFENLQLKIFPNPFKETTYISFYNNFKDMRIHIFISCCVGYNVNIEKWFKYHRVTIYFRDQKVF